MKEIGLSNRKHYRAIAGAIREKLDVETTYLPEEMAPAIRSIQSGGLPSEIRVCRLPEVLEYEYTAQDDDIDLTGIVVGAYREDGSLWTNEDYPTGRIPINELLPRFLRWNKDSWDDGKGVIAQLVDLDEVASAWGFTFKVTKFKNYGTDHEGGVIERLGIPLSDSPDKIFLTQYEERLYFKGYEEDTRSLRFFTDINNYYSGGAHDYTYDSGWNYSDAGTGEEPLNTVFPRSSKDPFTYKPGSWHNEGIKGVEVSWIRPDGIYLSDSYKVNPGEPREQIVLPSATLGEENYYSASDDGKVVNGGKLVDGLPPARGVSF